MLKYMETKSSEQGQKKRQHSLVFLDPATIEPHYENHTIGVSFQVCHKPACSYTETSYVLDISNIDTSSIVLYGKRNSIHIVRINAKVGFLVRRLKMRFSEKSTPNVVKLNEENPVLIHKNGHSLIEYSARPLFTFF